MYLIFYLLVLIFQQEWLITSFCFGGGVSFLHLTVSSENYESIFNFSYFKIFHTIQCKIFHSSLCWLVMLAIHSWMVGKYFLQSTQPEICTSYNWLAGSLTFPLSCARLSSISLFSCKISFTVQSCCVENLGFYAN